MNETTETRAYRQFIHDLALSLSNDSSTVDEDVRDIYEFEKNLSKVTDLRGFALETLFLPF